MLFRSVSAKADYGMRALLELAAAYQGDPRRLVKGEAIATAQGIPLKFLEGIVLMRQVFIKDETESKTIKDLVDALSMRCGEKVTVRRFSRLEVGEGIEKTVGNIAADVAAMVGGN